MFLWMHKITNVSHAGYWHFSVKNDLSLCRHGTWQASTLHQRHPHFSRKNIQRASYTLEETLTCWGKASFQINADKSEFFSKAPNFLGFVLTLEGYQPELKCVKAILAISAPTNIKVVRHFLGVCNFIKNNIPGQAALMEPITRLTKKTLSLHGRRNKKQLSS